MTYTIEINATFNPTAQKSMAISMRTNINNQWTAIVLQNDKGMVDFGINKCHPAVLCELPVADVTKATEMKIERFSLFVLDGKTVLPITQASFNKDTPLMPVKFATKFGTWDYGYKGSLGLAPNSHYLNWVRDNYVTEGNMLTFKIKLSERMQQVLDITAGRGVSIESYISLYFGSPPNTDSSASIELKNIGGDDTWAIYSKIGFGKGTALEGVTCFNPNQNNFLTVRTKEDSDKLNKAVSQ